MAVASHHAPEVQDDGEILLLDKPLDWTSFDVVHRVRQWLGIKKVGHAGTLDPRATGLLIVCTGRQTKQIDSFAILDKEYTGTFELGIRTPSFDMETEVTEGGEFAGISLEGLKTAIEGFTGRQLQTPPMYSAVKYHGKPLYKYARKGKTIERQAKEIDVKEFSVLSFVPPVVAFRVACSKGTYIRSLVSDLGERLGCGAALTSLRRTRIGKYSVEDAMTIEQLDKVHAERVSMQSVSDGHRIPA
ncbi:MAG: tRNA pseudouridine(55) synthase TruB [Ignavibacteriales bacterium]|nr:tRNA pseudouridine(55) synthase TruB [Ignavibacteriales bacterium]